MCITTICCWIWWRQRTIYIDRRLLKSRVYVYFNVIYLQFQLHFLVTSFCKFTKNWSEYWIFYYVIYYVYGLQQPTSTLIVANLRNGPGKLFMKDLQHIFLTKLLLIILSFEWTLYGIKLPNMFTFNWIAKLQSNISLTFYY